MDRGDSSSGIGTPVLERPRAEPRARPPLAVHHRRRRAGALALVASAALLAGVIAGAASSGGGAGSHRVALPPGSYFGRLRTLAGSGPGSLAAAERAAERRAIDHTLADTPYVRVAGSQHREVALTFDDGPGPYTLSILDELERLRAPATFFEVGVEEHYFSNATAQIVAHGYPIGDHTETHAPMSRLSRPAQQRQLLTQAAAIGDSGAPVPRLFRPPYGLWNKTTLALLHRYRMLMVLWTVDTSDYQMPGAAVIVHRALAGAKPGAIILLHDAGGNRSETLAAVPKIVKGLRARGYRLVTVSRLLLDNPAPHDQDVASLVGEGG